MNFKQLLSYIFPVNIFQIESKINQNLEVTWNNGKLVLDSKNTNFSFGSLERVMQIGLNLVGKEKIATYKSALILGVGGGSVINILQNEFRFDHKIIGVELDPVVIKIANTYFDLHKKPNLELVSEDAYEFVKNCNRTYDLIVIDIFQDTKMPDFLFSEDFVYRLKTILNNNGSVLFNTIVTLSSDFERNKNYHDLVSNHFEKVQKVSNVEGNNELFILRK